jgi:hypothetical protein
LSSELSSELSALLLLEELPPHADSKTIKNSMTLRVKASGNICRLLIGFF